MTGVLRASAVAAVERIGPLAAIGAVATAAAAMMVGPEALTMALVGIGCALLVTLRPQWGVAILLLLLMVQYGPRGGERGGVAGLLATLLPAGSGLLTVNNVLGILLALLLVYRVYRDRDWSFLQNRTVRLVLAVTGVLVFSGFVSGIGDDDLAAIGLEATSGQDPSRLLVSRALFLVLFVFFIEEPRDLLLIVGLFVVLSVATAWSGSQFAIGGAGQRKALEYRAGGMDVLISSTANPNRLAMIATFGMVFLWEYAQRRKLAAPWWLMAMAGVLLMILTVFLSASRGGLVGMVAAGLLMLGRGSLGFRGILRGLAIAAVGAVLVAQVIPVQSLERITSLPIPGREQQGDVGRGSAERRAYNYDIGLQIWKQAPIVGVGPGNWPYARYHLDPLRSHGVAHNSYLAALAEGGIVSLALYLVLFFTLVRDLWRLEVSPSAIEHASADGLAWVISATRISLVAFLVSSIFYDLWDLIFSYFLMSVAAVLIRRYQPWCPAMAQARVGA